MRRWWGTRGGRGRSRGADALPSCLPRPLFRLSTHTSTATTADVHPTTPLSRPARPLSSRIDSLSNRAHPSEEDKVAFARAPPPSPPAHTSCLRSPRPRRAASRPTRATPSRRPPTGAPGRARSRSVFGGVDRQRQRERERRARVREERERRRIEPSASSAPSPLNRSAGAPGRRSQCGDGRRRSPRCYLGARGRSWDVALSARARLCERPRRRRSAAGIGVGVGRGPSSSLVLLVLQAPR